MQPYPHCPSDSESDNEHEAAMGPPSPSLTPPPPHTPQPNVMCHHPVTRSRLKLALSPSPAVLSQPSSSTSTTECPQTFSALNAAQPTSQCLSNSDPSMLQKDDAISFCLKNKQSWDTGHLISRSGKSTGK